MSKNKEILRAQPLFWGQLKEKIEQHHKQTGLSISSIIKTGMNEYYSKINTDYNK